MLWCSIYEHPISCSVVLPIAKIHGLRPKKPRDTGEKLINRFGDGTPLDCRAFLFLYQESHATAAAAVTAGNEATAAPGRKESASLLVTSASLLVTRSYWKFDMSGQS